MEKAWPEAKYPGFWDAVMEIYKYKDIGFKSTIYISAHFGDLLGKGFTIPEAIEEYKRLYRSARSKREDLLNKRLYRSAQSKRDTDGAV